MVQYKIYPPIGIARLGDSPDEWFIGPEIPGADNRPPGGYKSADCRIKRQGARFRIYECGDDGQPVLEGGHPKEITSAQAQITWRVRLANIKGSATRFYPIGSSALRNPNAKTKEARDALEIRTEELSLDAPNGGKAFTAGTFRGVPTLLGEIRTDADGRLIVLGGSGVSRAVGADGKLLTSATIPVGPDSYDGDDWHDDVSDGPVRATVLIDGKSFEAASARVVVAPPDYAPPIRPVVSLYDRILETLTPAFAIPPVTPSFNRDIYPLLVRARDVRRVFPMPDKHGTLDQATADPKTPAAKDIFAKLIPPGGKAEGKIDMPKLVDDDHTNGFSLTKVQYAMLDAWANGQEGKDWINDWTGAPPKPDVTPTPEGLTRAALESCIGRGLRPGIEAGRFLVEKPDRYIEPFRLIDSIGPGEITAQMALPWQGDFAACSKDPSNFAWWPTQRPDEVFPEAGGDQQSWFVGIGNGKLGGDYLLDVWSQLGFVVSKGGALVETERVVQCRNISIVLLREAVAEAEVEAALDPSVPMADKGRIKGVLSVRVGGCKPSDLGITAPPGPQDPVGPLAPTIKLFNADGSAFKGFTPDPVGIELQTPNVGQTQIVAFTYDLIFSSKDPFWAGDDPIESQMITVAAKHAWDDGEKKGKATGETTLELTNIVSPFIKIGPTPWLASDLRVFKVALGSTAIDGVPGIGGDAAAARLYIAQVLDRLNQAPAGANPFDALPVDQEASALQLYSATEDKKPVFNFAVARVTFTGKADPAKDVRVFFRLFTTAALGLGYDLNHAYRRSADLDAPVPLLGLDASNAIVTMPFFARARVDSSTQPLALQEDDANVRTLEPAGPGGATYAYFGCWLDINQPDDVFQQHPSPPDGPWTTDRQPIQKLINGEHQCLVAEVAYRDRPIKPGAAPGADNRLAQRNLVWAKSDNPGGPETRTVQHSFAIKAPPRTADPASRPDELVIHRQGLPAGSRVRLYAPDLDADEVLAIARDCMDYPGLVRIDAHTLECLPGDVAYVPLPSGLRRDVAALLSVELPEGVRKGQQFRCVLQQVSGHRRSVQGGFQLEIPISTARALLAPERRRLSLLRFLTEAKAADDPWRAVLVRLTDQVAARLRGYGGDPASVAPAPDGDGQAASSGLACRLMGMLLALLAAASVVMGGLKAPQGYLGMAAGVLCALLVGLAWIWLCKPPLRRIGRMLGTGLSAGAGLLGLLMLLGLGGPDIGVWLAASAAAGAAILLASLAAGP